MKRQEHIDFILKWSNYTDRATANQQVSKFTELLIHETGQGLNLSEAILSRCNLAGFNLRRATFNQAQMYETNLTNANLSEAKMICPGLERTNFTGVILKGAYLHALAAQVCKFDDADFSEITDATGSLFHGCSMSSINAEKSMFAGSTFYQCNLNNTNFTGTNLQGCSINECVLDNVNLSASLLSQLTITKTRMQGTLLDHSTGKGLVLQRLTCCDEISLTNANLPLLRCDSLLGSGINAEGLNAPDADFSECSFCDANFSKSILSNSRWKSCHFQRADFSDAKLDESSFSNSAMLESVFERVMAENIRVVESRLPKAKMSGFKGRCASFRDCDLSEVDLSKSYLYRAVLTGDPAMGMCMKRINLRDAILVQSYITADLSYANLSGAHCTYARLNNCDMHGANLSGANVYEASLIKTNLTDAQLTGINSPFFADRCPGLFNALEVSDPDKSISSIVDFLSGLEKLLMEFKESARLETSKANKLSCFHTKDLYCNLAPTSFDLVRMD